MAYEVEKFGRSGDGKWFGFGARRFGDIAQARDYFMAFASGQKRVLSNGIRIDLRERKGRKVLAIVGGRLTDPTIIRHLDGYEMTLPNNLANLFTGTANDGRRLIKVGMAGAGRDSAMADIAARLPTGWSAEIYEPSGIDAVIIHRAQ